MRYIKYISFILILAAIFLHGCESNDEVSSSICIPQPVNKKVLVEFFTNAGCIPCVAAHGYLDEISANTCATINDTSVIIISYHTKYPYIFDSLYRANVEQNDARASYYGVISTPKGSLDGVSMGTSFSAYEWSSQVNVEFMTTAYLGLELSNEFNASSDSGQVTAEITLLSPLPTTDNVLHVLVTENKVPYVTAPNGIKYPSDVMRYMVTGSEGEDISIGPANTVVKSYVLAPNWNTDNCYLTVFVQSKSTKQVFGVERIKVN
jgi:hypothetical protein